jgi:CHAT domain
VLEDYPSRSPFDHSIARSVSVALDDYGRDLLDQLNLVPFIQERLGPHDPLDVIFEVQDLCRTSQLQSLHWETLEKSCAATAELSHVFLSVRRTVVWPEEDSDQTCELVSAPGFPAKKAIVRSYNILLVVSRPLKEDDIDPLLGAKAINAVVKELAHRIPDFPIIVEIARPGTWKAFDAYIKGRTKQWWQSGGEGNWFDMVHFDVHGTLEDDTAYLMFLTRSGRKTLFCSGEDVGQTLQECHVPCVLLNACESAKVTGSSNSNFARTLVNSGAKAVVAMSFKLTSTAAQIFIRTFYYHFLAGPSRDMTGALRVARSALRVAPERLGKLDTTVYLPDYFVPVMYVRVEHSGAEIEATLDDDNVTLETADKTDSEAQTFGTQSDRTELTSPIFGREQDVLALEWLLLREGHPNIAILTGPPGVGKTTLIKFLGDWWLDTNLIGRPKYWSLRSDKPRRVIRHLRAWNFTWPRDFPRRPTLFMLDHLDETHSAGPENNDMTPEEKAELAEIFNLYRDRSDLILLVSRSPEEWCGLPKQQRLSMRGLSYPDSIDLAARTIVDTGWGPFLKDSNAIDLIQGLNSRFNHIPLVIEFFLRNAQRMCSDPLRPNTEQHFPYDADHPQNILPDNIQNLLYYSLFNPLADLTDHPTSLECMNFIRKLWQSGTTQDQLALASLLPLSGAYPEDWYDDAYKGLLRIYGPSTPSRDHIVQYVSKNLLDSGWGEKVDDPHLEGLGRNYIWIHPIFTNLLRLKVLQEGLIPLQDHMWLTFILHQLIWAHGMLPQYAQKQARREIQIGATGLLAACTVCFHVVVSSQSRVFQPCQVSLFLQVLWNTATLSNTPILSPALLIMKMEQLLDLTEKRLSAGHIDQATNQVLFRETNIDVILFLCEALSQHFLLKSPVRAAAYVQRLIAQVTSVAHRDADWGREDRRHQTVVCLLNLGNCRLSQNLFDEAGTLASLALRSRRPGASNDSKILDIHVRLIGYSVLYKAAVALQDTQANMEWYASQVSQALDDRERFSAAVFKGTQSNYILLESDEYSSTRALVSGMTTQMPSVVEMGKLVKDGYLDKAKDLLLDGVATARQIGSPAAEASYQAELAEISMTARDWVAASLHIDRLNELKSSKDSGPWRIYPHYNIHNQSCDDQVRAARYGSIFLHLDDLGTAISYFWQAVQARAQVDTNKIPDTSPESFIEYTVFLVRANLLLLTAVQLNLLSYPDFDGLDDTFQRLLLREIASRWPEYDQQVHGTAKTLQRAFNMADLHDINTSDGPAALSVGSLLKMLSFRGEKTPPGDVLVALAEPLQQQEEEGTGARLFQSKFQKWVRVLLGLGRWLRCVFLGKSRTQIPQGDQVDTKALEKLLAYSTGLVTPENPR